MKNTSKMMESSIEKESNEFRDMYYNKWLPNTTELCNLELEGMRRDLRMNENVWNFRSIKTENKEVQKKYDNYTVALYEIKEFNEKVKEAIHKYGDPNIDFYIDHRINFE